MGSTSLGDNTILTDVYQQLNENN